MFKSFLRIFETVFTVLSLVHFTQGFLPLILTGGFNEGDAINGGPSISSFDLSAVRNVNYLIYLVIFFLLFLRWKKAILLLQKDRYILIFTSFIFFSFLWSELPTDSLAAGVTAVGATAFGLYLATRYTIEEQLKLISWAYVLIILLSLIFVIVVPEYAFMSGIHKGAMRGIYTHKNQFGLMMIIGALVFLIRALGKQKLLGFNWLLWVFFSISVATVALSRSTTSIVNLFLVVSLLFIYRAFRWRYEILIPAALAAIFIGFVSFVLVTNNTEFILTSLGKDPTLTGRTDLWSLVWDKIQEKPWLGYGVKGFWKGLDGPSQHVQLGLRTKVIYAHNGFLDLWITVGIIGMIIFAVGLVMSIIKALSWIRLSNSIESIWPLIGITYLLLANATESPMLLFNNILWVLYTAINFSLLLPETQQLKLAALKA
jgi:exopolysaccharide production protein ExoQ